MIVVHCPTVGTNGERHLDQRTLGLHDAIPADALWIDLLEPTRGEERRVEEFIKVFVPTREDLDFIEPSELLYTEDGAHYMTTRLLFNVDGSPDLADVGFLLKDNVLITIRYDEPKAFALFANRASKANGCGPTAPAVLAGLIDTITDRAAEVLQQVGDGVNDMSRQVFEQKSDPGKRNAEYQELLRQLGRYGDLLTKLRESLLTVERAVLFLSVAYRSARVPMELREQVRSTLRDLQSLGDHANFQNGKIQFLLDATLGLVNLEQNNIIKLFSVMAVVFMPPTMIASIYGMNFRAMPELDWHLGYPFALLLMLVAAIAPYFFFRWKRWL